MREAKQLKNVALLRNLTVHRTLMYKRTRWFRKFHTLRRSDKIRDELRDVRRSSSRKVSLGRGSKFANEVRN